MLHTDQGTADFFEAFVALTIFAKGEFEKKLQGLFYAYDIDQSGGIDRKEMTTFVHSGVFGLCKLLGIREEVS